MGKYDTLINNPKDSELLAIAEINELAEQNRLTVLTLRLRYRVDRRPVLTMHVISDDEFEDKA